MSSLSIYEDDIPSLYGKRVIITGASSGIGQAAAAIFAQKGASVLNLDVNPRRAGHMKGSSTDNATCLTGIVSGVSEETDYFADTFDMATGDLLEPQYRVLDVNLRAVLNFTKLAISHFRGRKHAGSIVITSSATAYAPEQSLPVYSAAKLALIGLVRSLRSALLLDSITVNAIAPAATITNLLPKHLAAPIIASGLPVSSAEFVGLAVVYSAVASQSHPVELYGKDNGSSGQSPSRWNGRTILTLGAEYTELEEPIAALRPQWFGAKNTELTRLQQAATDFRTFV